MISPVETAEMFRRRAAELAADPPVPLTDQQSSHLALQIGIVARALTDVVTAYHRGYTPVRLAVAEVLVDLGRQLAPPPVDRAAMSRPEPLPRGLRGKTRRRGKR